LEIYQNEYTYDARTPEHHILDMFRTSNCSSSGGLYKQLTVFYCVP